MFVVAVLIIGLGAGVLASTVFVSPQQRQAATQPPDIEPLFESVRIGRLSDEIQLRANIRREYKDDLEIASTDAPRTVVTEVRTAVGGRVEHGAAPLAVNGRPIFILEGDFPFFRDLETNMEGADIVQLQDGLRTAGYHVSEAETGRFGPTTRQAVAQMYEAAGVSPPVHLVGGSVDRPPVPTMVVPRSDLLVAPRLPAVLLSAPMLGADLNDGAVLSLGSGELIAIGGIDAASYLKLTPGMAVTLVADNGEEQRATVRRTIEYPPDEEGSSPSYTVEIATAEPLNQEWHGQNVLARIIVEAVSSDVPIVPTRALIPTAEGTFELKVRRPDHSVERIVVTEVASLRGESAVRSADGVPLSKEDEVRVD